jgi:hypothetical protein
MGGEGDVERSAEPITGRDLEELYAGSMECLSDYFVWGKGRKWQALYDIGQPIAVALCQGAAMHYFDKINGVKDFDVWFFYPFNQRHLPYRTIWSWDYANPKFGRHPGTPGYHGRRVDVVVRSIKNFTQEDPVATLLKFLRQEDTVSSRELAKKAVVLLAPEPLIGRVVWYPQKDRNRLNTIQVDRNSSHDEVSRTDP